MVAFIRVPTFSCSIFHHGHLPGRANRQDGGLGRVDDRDEMLHIVHAQVADREGRAFDIVRAHLASPGPGHHVFHLCRNQAQIGFWSASRQTTVSRPPSTATATPTLTCPWRTIFASADRGIQVRELAQGQRDRFDDEIVDRELLIVRQQGVDLVAQRQQRLHVVVRGSRRNAAPAASIRPCAGQSRRAAGRPDVLVGRAPMRRSRLPGASGTICTAGAGAARHAAGDQPWCGAAAGAGSAKRSRHPCGSSARPGRCPAPLRG